MNEQDFHKAMIDIYKLALKHCNYRATRFLQMVSNEGGLRTAKTLLKDEKISDGFISLLENNRLDLTMEALVVNKECSHLFTEDEIKIARDRLLSYGYLLEETIS